MHKLDKFQWQRRNPGENVQFDNNSDVNTPQICNVYIYTHKTKNLKNVIMLLFVHLCTATIIQLHTIILILQEHIFV